MNYKGGYALVGPYKDASSGLMIATMGKTISAPQLEFCWNFYSLSMLIHNINLI